MNETVKGITRELAALTKMNIAGLQSKYLEAFGEVTTSRNAEYLRKRIAYRVQELAEGGLTERARARIKELGERAPLRERERAPDPAGPVRKRDPRLPPAGEMLRKFHQGVMHEVAVVEEGFLYKGKFFSTLSAIAKVITGTTWNGMLFFGIATRKKKEAA